MIVVPTGYSFAAVEAGFRYTGRQDLGLILSSRPAAAAGVFTTNRFQAAPVLVAGEHLRHGHRARGIVVNAGQANACTGEQGVSACRGTCDMIAKAFGIQAEEILPASTGVIGEPMDLQVWERAVRSLAGEDMPGDPLAVAKAMLTTDTFPKIGWREISLSGGKVRLLGLAKGSGMICPNMATMLGFVICDAEIDARVWQEMLSRTTAISFNRISVDGDTSTNDCVLALANGAAGISPQGPDLSTLEDALGELCRELADLIVQDAEGGTKMVRIQVRGAQDEAQAEVAARTVAHSPLVKTAMFGQDPNWGRIVAALGRCGADFDPERVRVSIAGREVFSRGTPVDADLDSLLAPYLSRQEIPIDIELGAGPGTYWMVTSDLSVEYVRINAEYRS